MNISNNLNNVAQEMTCLRTGGLRIVDQLTIIVDNLIVNAFNSVKKSFITSDRAKQANIVVVAIGGYGRRDLTAHSDIDIMLLAEKRDGFSEKMAEAFLYHLWDMGMNISHSFRTLDECLEDAMKDITIRTSLMESRFITGDAKLYERYRYDIYQKIVFRRKGSFISAIIREADKRHKKSGDSAYLLEPDIKEGKGSLRDIHSIRWLAKTSFRIQDKEELSKILSKKDYIHLLKAYDFLLKIRICLHSISKRRNDILSFEFHSSVAEMMSLKSTKKHHAAEILMRLYYKKAGHVFFVLNKVMHLCSTQYIKHSFDFYIKRISPNFSLSRNEIIIKNHEILKKIDNILEAFYLYSLTGKRFSYQLKCAINNKAVYIRKNESSKTAIRYFMQVLKGKRVYEALRQMHDSVVLDRFIPEFGRLRHLVIYEPYHKYTVDEHTLLSIKNLDELKNTKNEKLLYLKEIFGGIKQEVLFLALLLHDIGKGFDPSGTKRHEEKSYKIIKGILERFDLPAYDSRKIEFLVKNHIILSKIALTRDTDAPETVTSLCEIIENEENLNYLLLMTYADMTAVNPSFWTEWKACLLYDLMNKAKKHLKGVFENEHAVPDPEINGFIQDMPHRYLISNTIDEVKADYLIVLDIADKNLSVSINKKADGTAEILIATFDVLGLFTRIVRVLSSKGFNIVRARLYTSKSGLVLDKILISNWSELWWDGVEEELKEALKKGIFQKLEDVLLYERPGGSYAEKKTKGIATFPRFEYFIEIDNDVSSEYTLLEIASPDRLALLYDISSQLYFNKVDIISAIINTEQGIAQDVFYLQCEDAKLNSEVISKVLNSMYCVIYE